MESVDGMPCSANVQSDICRLSFEKGGVDVALECCRRVTVGDSEGVGCVDHRRGVGLLTVAAEIGKGGEGREAEAVVGVAGTGHGEVGGGRGRRGVVHDRLAGQWIYGCVGLVNID